MGSGGRPADRSAIGTCAASGPAERRGNALVLEGVRAFLTGTTASAVESLRAWLLARLARPVRVRAATICVDEADREDVVQDVLAILHAARGRNLGEAVADVLRVLLDPRSATQPAAAALRAEGHDPERAEAVTRAALCTVAGSRAIDRYRSRRRAASLDELEGDAAPAHEARHEGLSGRALRRLTEVTVELLATGANRRGEALAADCRDLEEMLEVRLGHLTTWELAERERSRNARPRDERATADVALRSARDRVLRRHSNLRERLRAALGEVAAPRWGEESRAAVRAFVDELLEAKASGPRRPADRAARGRACR